MQHNKKAVSLESFLQDILSNLSPDRDLMLVK